MNHHPIDPKIDCVFKALLGAEDNRALLIHFLNANLNSALPAPITEVEILNPYNDKEFLDDKLSIVDVKARDQHGNLYPDRNPTSSATGPPPPASSTPGQTFYSAQLKTGQDYGQLKPTYAIWLLGETLLPERPEAIHDFRLRDSAGRGFIEHGGIWLLELNKHPIHTVQTEQHRWLKFFQDGEQLNAEALPTWMDTDEMRQAMSTLKRFSEKDRAYHAYQARQNYLREQRSIQRHLEELQAETEQLQAEAERRRVEAEQFQVEAERRRVEAEQLQAEAEQARRREALAQAREEQERAAKEQERAAREQAQAREEQERAAKEAALAEIERLKAQLRGE
ncbi:PD-(D/E)XK nuclease family transposase [Thiorhodospira sibirica]|uniref:PD-(D/E)XK nuclease family transposase n=1 Tax=Thiorhodospira sibirica TaxID=154347 RepID=UPI001FE292EC|nr:PD-(D/E)XK nuclease family transposase [Thiorhodospira sibirica]